MQTHDEQISVILDLAQVMTRDLDGRITGWSSGAARLYGWPSDAAVGQISHRLLATVFPKPLSEIETDLLRDGEWHGELQHTNRDGHHVHVASHWALQRDRHGHPLAVVEVNNDITERRRADMATLRLAAIVESSHEVIISRTLDGTVVTWNKAAEHLFGYRADEMIGEPLSKLFPPDRRNEQASILERIRHGENLDHYLTRQCLKDGSEIPVALAVSPIYDPGGTIVGASTIIRDLRERMRLQEMQAELIHVSRLTELGQMVSALAHEVNQPLAAIANYGKAAQRLLGRGDTERVQASLGRLLEQADRASQIVQRLREFVRKGEAVRRPENLARIIEEASALAMVGLQTQDIKIELRLDPQLPEVLIDKVQVQQVLFNLIRNAIEAMAEQPRRELGLGARAVAHEVEVQVADTGPGLPELVRAKLFQPFVTTKPAGMGVGLSICRSIVESHGGRLQADANPTGGTIFRFTLPVFEGDNDRALHGPDAQPPVA